MEYIAPRSGIDAFNCPFCDAYANQTWAVNLQGSQGKYLVWIENYTAAICACCRRPSIWYGSKLVHPAISPAPLPVMDMPDSVKTDYEEARNIAGASPRAAAALLRLALQKLCVLLGGAGKNINDDIGTLVAKGLSAKIQKALDSVRVIGNNAVHPGEIDLEDRPETALGLFKLLNMIVVNMISEPKEIDLIYESLPSGAKAAVEKRDTSKK